MRNKMKLIAVLLLVCLASCRVSKPGGVETAVISEVKRRVTVGGKTDHNPLPGSAENVRMGQVAYSHYCIVCHGLDGQATGVPFADAMSPPIPSLASKSVQQYTDGQLKWIIENGISPSGMPASKNILNQDEIWAIVVFLRHLPPKGSVGEPKVYTDADDTPSAGHAQ